MTRAGHFDRERIDVHRERTGRSVHRRDVDRRANRDFPCPRRLEAKRDAARLDLAHHGIDAFGKHRRRSDEGRSRAVSGASELIWRWMVGRLELSLINSFGEPATIA